MLVSLTQTSLPCQQVGNQDFANYIDAQNRSVTHINNKDDPVPILPPLLLGFKHPNGEIHIGESEQWDSCPGASNLIPSNALTSNIGGLMSIPMCTRPRQSEPRLQHRRRESPVQQRVGP